MAEPNPLYGRFTADPAEFVRDPREAFEETPCDSWDWLFQAQVYLRRAMQDHERRRELTSDAMDCIQCAVEAMELGQ